MADMQGAADRWRRGIDGIHLALRLRPVVVDAVFRPQPLHLGLGFRGIVFLFHGDLLF